MPGADIDQANLAGRLKARIAANGPLRVEDYMRACLHDPGEGAYGARQPIGADGHFITAPEISQIFGELLGLWAVAVWQQMGEPPHLTLAELGPGRGTLMADALRAARASPVFLRSVSVAMVEASPPLAALQRKALAETETPLRWYGPLDELPEGPLIVLANEFLDALPIRQFVRRGSEWRERLIGLDGEGGFALVDGAAAAIDREADDGDILETRPAIDPLLAALAGRAAKAPLAALFIDYGPEASGLGDTLQAVRAHAYADPLADPGAADLTAHVDFASLRRSAETLGLRAYGPMPQGEFLLKLGLGVRLERLLESAEPQHKEAIASGALRLADPSQMGVLFKALALTSEGLPPPPPFA